MPAQQRSRHRHRKRRLAQLWQKRGVSRHACLYTAVMRHTCLVVFAPRARRSLFCRHHALGIVFDGRSGLAACRRAPQWPGMVYLEDKQWTMVRLVV
jgi:hypothetical protein